MSVSLILENVIISYPTLFTPRKLDDNSDAKYSLNALIPKDSPDVARIQAAIQQAVTETFGTNVPARLNTTFNDCSVRYPDDQKLHGYMELRCSAGVNQKPEIIDINRQPVLDPSKVYGGVEACIALNIAGYSMTTSKGVTGYINAVMLTGNEGVLGRLDNRKSAEELFAGVGAAPAQYETAGPTYGQAPAPTAPAPTAPAPTAPAPTAPAPAPAAPTAPAPTAPAAPAAPADPHQMTPDAAGVTYQAFRDAGWSDEQLIQAGKMLPPGGVGTAF